MNVISLWKCQEAVSHTIRSTLDSNHQSLAAKLSDVLLFDKYSIKDTFFYEQLGWIRLQSNFQESAFPDVFADGISCLTTGLELDRYEYAARRN